MLVEELLKYTNLEIDPHLRKLWVSIYNSMIVHTRGEQPKELLEINRPNEPKEIIKYRVDTYFPITKDPILKALNSTYHLIKQSDYKLICSDNIKEYLKEKKFESVVSINKLNIYDLIFKSFLQLNTEDPNAVIFVEAQHPTDKNDIPNNRLKTEEVDIEIKYIPSKNIRYIDENILVYNYKTTYVDEVECIVYKIVNDTDIWIYHPTKFNDKNELIYELRPYYNHNFGFIPFRVLGGLDTIKSAEVKEKNKKVNKEYRLFDTYFTAYNSWANKAIIASSETDAVKVRYGFPVTERLATVCNTCKGRKEIPEPNCNNNDCKDIRCPNCNGLGVEIALSPYSEILKSPPNPINGEVATDIPTIRYYSPPMDAIAINKEYWYEMMDKAEQSISIYQSFDNQSGVAKEIDREQKRDFISVIGNNLFSLLEFSVKCISKYKFDDTQVRVIEPIRYEIRNKESVVKEITELNAVNKSLAKPLSLEYVEMEYDGNEKRILEILIENDIYYDYSLQDLSTLQAMQRLDNNAFEFHMNGYKWLSELLEAESNMSKTNSELVTLAYEKIIPREPTRI
jgi:hypothetical protein